MYNGLSLDQAPPISVVIRFFITVPIIGILLSLLILTNPHAVLTPNHPISLSAIHLMFLGIITMSMLGALFQMQSVLGGKAIPSPVGNAFIIHLFLIIGILALGNAFLFTIPPLFVIASIFLGISLFYTLFLILPLLFSASSHETLRGMRLALIALSLTAFLGIIMASEYAHNSFSSLHEILRISHYSLGLIGWVATLIIAVAFQVVEMFYVTESYSPWCKRNAFQILSIALILKIIGLFLGFAFVWIFDLIIGGLLVGFVVTTLKRLATRKRRVSDVSIWFWVSGMILLLMSMLAYTLFSLNSNEMFQSLAFIAFSLFALAIILGMMGKIIPFLIWFHLNASGYMNAPIMSNIIPFQRAKALFILFVLTALSALLGVLFLKAFLLSALTGGVMFALLFYNILIALKLYRYTLTHGTRFEF
ncbi:hypothetical protein [Sulfuricurvum sp.]|uniref:hypothetical protein n=1 Tax=Sulfuricurvum sp. TaxID=2025608 RepID=UPI003BB74946